MVQEQLLHRGDPVPKPVKKLGAGTIIMYEGKLIVAQKRIVKMLERFEAAKSSDPIPIGNLNSIFIDNENRYIGDATTNSFKILENDGA